VRLRDDGTSIRVSWLDPVAGPAPVVIALARDEQPATIVTTLAVGTREYTLDKLDPSARYCVIVAAVYPGETSSAATSVCTTR
jgi:DNA-binding NarL/FixJ family response regulator